MLRAQRRSVGSSPGAEHFKEVAHASVFKLQSLYPSALVGVFVVPGLECRNLCTHIVAASIPGPALLPQLRTKKKNSVKFSDTTSDKIEAFKASRPKRLSRTDRFNPQ